MKKIQDSQSLTFTNDDTNVDMRFQDDETLLVNININFQQKFTVKEFRKRISQLIDSEDLYNDMIEEDDRKLSKYTMFYIMLENLIDFMLSDCDEEFIKTVKDSLIFTEQSDILQKLSERRFDIKTHNVSSIEIEKIPSNYSMSLCSCCKNPDETNDITDFSKDNSPE